MCPEASTLTDFNWFKRRSGTMREVNLVSVIIPAFNAVATLAETIRSVCAQSHLDLEIIIVHDGSTDETAALADAHARHDSRTRVVRTRNGGVAAARNAGVAASRGAFLAPADADDLWTPKKSNVSSQ